MNDEAVTFIIELIQAVFTATNGADDPYTLDIPSQENIQQTEARLARLSGLSGIDVEQLRARINFKWYDE